MNEPAADLPTRRAAHDGRPIIVGASNRQAVRGTYDNSARVPPVVILAAGEGSRLREGGDHAVPKPLVELVGLSIGERSIITFQAAGIERFVIVLGWEAEQIGDHFAAVAVRRNVQVDFVYASDWKQGNGASTLASAPRFDDSRFLIAMVDHLFTPAMIRTVLASPPAVDEVRLAIDRDKGTVFDLDDLTKVGLAADGRITAIGKHLEPWDAGDTGLFYASRGLFVALAEAGAAGQHGLSDGVRRCGAAGRLRAIDVTGHAWLDIDTPEAFREAETRLRAVASLR